jgi:hypoxanthine phosphoribosyltransferase
MQQLPWPKKLIGSWRIRLRVWSLGKVIWWHYRRLVSVDMPLMVVIVQKGGFMFGADLVRQVRCPGLWWLRLPMRLKFTRVKSYHGRTKATGPSEVHDVITEGIAGHHVVVVDDILDEGKTLTILLDHLGTLKPQSLLVAVMLAKRGHQRHISPQYLRLVRYIGFWIPDVFVVGHGLDFKGCYRDNPDIGFFPDGKDPF